MLPSWTTSVHDPSLQHAILRQPTSLSQFESNTILAIKIDNRGFPNFEASCSPPPLGRRDLPTPASCRRWSSHGSGQNGVAPDVQGE